MSILGDAKEIADFIKKAGDIELYKKIVDLQSDLVELTEERNKLKEENVRLKEKKNIKKFLRFDKCLYWLKDSSDGESGPYCVGCWDSVGRLARLTDQGDERMLQCLACKEYIHTTKKPR